MSEIPALRDALRDTAQRKVDRRRRRLTLAIAVPIAAAFVVFALAAVRPRTEETTIPPTSTPTPAPAQVTLDDAERELAQVYGVFRRPARASDRPPRGVTKPKSIRVELDRNRARRVATLGERAAYVVPIVYAGRVGLCFYTRSAPERPAGGGCGEFAPIRSKPVWNKTFDRPATVYALLLPDGVERVTVHLDDGRKLTRDAGENGFIYQGRGVKRFTWRDAEGKEHSTRATI